MSLTPFLFTLDSNGNPVPEPNVQTWIAWMGANVLNCILQSDTVGQAKIVTGFTGVNIGIDPATEDPFLYMTSVTGGPYDGFKQSYTQKTDALSNHATVVANLTAGQAP